MVESEQVQDRRVPVVDVDFSLNGFVAVVVRFAVRESAFDTAAAHPRRVAFVVVVATRTVNRVRCSSKLPAPDDQRIS